MPAEKYVTEFVKEAGFTPIPDRAIIVTYAPANMSERIAKFFSNEFFALQMCQDSLVLLPFGRMSLMLKKDVALEIPLPHDPQSRDKRRYAQLAYRVGHR